MKEDDSTNYEKWFRVADDDLKFAKAGFRETKIPHDACFLCQQVVEKYLKAFILQNGQEFKKIHDLMKLLKKCILIDRNLEEIIDDCRKLNKYYSRARYPDDLFIDYTIEEAEEAIKSAERVVNFIKNLNITSS